MGEHFLAGLTVDVLPAATPATFHGRTAETAGLADFLRSRDVRQVVVIGPAGVGKSTLVCRLLREPRTANSLLGVVHLSRIGDLPAGYPQLLHGLSRFLSPDDATRLAGRLRLAQETPTAMVHAVLDALPAGRVVVLLDGAEELITPAGAISDAALEEALRALLSAPPHGVTVVITTRVAPGPLLAHRPDVQRRIDLTGLPGATAVELLRARDPDGELGLRDAPVLMLTRTARLLSGNPRALEALAAAAGDPDTTVSELLDQIGSIPADEVYSTLAEAAFDSLDPLVREVVETLAVFPVPVPADAVDGVLHAFYPEVDSAAALRALEARWLVHSVDGRYSVHPADRDHLLAGIPEGVPTEVRPPPFTRSALRTLAANLLVDAATPAADWTSVDDLVPQLAEFALRCANADFDGAARVLVRGGWEELRSWGHLRFALALLARLPERVGEPRLNGWCVSALASCYAGLGQPNRAVELHERARMICVRTTDAVGEATQLANLGRCHAELGDVQRAVRLHERAQVMYREAGDRVGEAGQLVDLAWCHVELGRPEQAVDLLDQVLARPTGGLDHNARIDALALAGAARREIGDLGQAIELHERGVKLAVEAGDRRGEATHTGLLGVCHVRAGRIGQAMALHQQALDTFHAIGHRTGEATEQARLAVCHVLREELSPALDLNEKALVTARETGDFRMQAACLTSLSWCFLHLDDTEQAQWFAEQAIDLAGSTGSAGAQARAQLGLARTHLWADRPAPAEKAVRAAARIRFPATELEIALVSGAIALRRGERLQASSHFSTAVKLVDGWLHHSTEHVDYAALDIRALARAGLVVSHDDPADAAVADFHAARALTHDDGVVWWALHWLDNLTPSDRPDVLDDLRAAAAGR